MSETISYNKEIQDLIAKYRSNFGELFNQISATAQLLEILIINHNFSHQISGVAVETHTLLENFIITTYYNSDKGFHLTVTTHDFTTEFHTLIQSDDIQVTIQVKLETDIDFSQTFKIDDFGITEIEN